WKSGYTHSAAPAKKFSPCSPFGKYSDSYTSFLSNNVPVFFHVRTQLLNAAESLGLECCCGLYTSAESLPEKTKNGGHRTAQKHEGKRRTGACQHGTYGGKIRRHRRVPFPE